MLLNAHSTASPTAPRWVPPPVPRLSIFSVIVVQRKQSVVSPAWSAERVRGGGQDVGCWRRFCWRKQILSTAFIVCHKHKWLLILKFITRQLPLFAVHFAVCCHPALLPRPREFMCEWVCLHIKWLPCEAAGQLMELHIWALLAWEYEPQKQNETMGKDLEQAEIVEDICKYIITYCPPQN